MVRNKDSHFPGPRHIEDPKAKTENASKRPNREINSRPQNEWQINRESSYSF